MVSPILANIYLDMQRIYRVTLAKDTEPPLAPRSDEVGKAEEKRANELLQAIEKHYTTGCGKVSGMFVRNKLKTRHGDAD